jgi:hypothetical protein
MLNPQFIQQGWPIGSGMVESANKDVVEARLKGTGMHWQATHVNPMLAIPNILCSDRWETAWPQIETHLRTQATQHRRQQRQQRRQAKDERLLADTMARQPAESPPAPETANTAKVKHRPAANRYRPHSLPTPPTENLTRTLFERDGNA